MPPSPALAGRVVARARSRTKIPRALLHFWGERFQASEVKATRRPSPEIAGWLALPMPGGPSAPSARDDELRPARAQVAHEDLRLARAPGPRHERDPATARRQRRLEREPGARGRGDRARAPAREVAHDDVRLARGVRGGVGDDRAAGGEHRLPRLLPRRRDAAAAAGAQVADEDLRARAGAARERAEREVAAVGRQPRLVELGRHARGRRHRALAAAAEVAHHDPGAAARLVRAVVGLVGDQPPVAGDRRVVGRARDRRGRAGG